MRLIIGLALGGLLIVWMLTDSLAVTGAQITPTPTSAHPLYLPWLSRRAGPVTPSLPPPVTPIPITGYVCRRPGGSGICWSSAQFTLMRGPGEPCGDDMSIAYYLTSDLFNLELYGGEYVRVRGATEEFPACPPLMRVIDLVVITER